MRKWAMIAHTVRRGQVARQALEWDPQDRVGRSEITLHHLLSQGFDSIHTIRIHSNVILYILYIIVFSYQFSER